MNTRASNAPQSLEQDRYLRLLECSKAIPWELDLSNWCFSYVGPQVVELLGYPIDAWYQPGFWLDKIHPEDKIWAPAFCMKATSLKENHSFEYRMLKSDGSVIWLRDDVNVVSDSTSVIALQGFMFDITEHKQAEGVINNLASSGSIHNTDVFFRNCVKNLAELYHAKYAFIGLINDDKNSVTTFTVWAGDGYVDNFIYELEGTPCKDVLDLSKELIARNAAKEYPNDQMLVEMNIDSYYGAPLISSNNEILGLVSVMDTKPMEPTHLSAPILGVYATRIAVELERKFATEALGKMNETLELRIDERTEQLALAFTEMESFSYSVSHDLRSPLRAIDGFSMALLEDYSDQLDEAALNYLNRIRNSAQHMGELIDDLLNLSRIVRCDIQIEKVLMSDISSQIYAKYQLTNSHHKIDFINKNENIVDADPNLLRILLENLLDNAFKYTAKKVNPIVEFNSLRENNELIHYVKDNGAGFDMKFTNKLFTPFQRFHDKREFEGNGIGLATVKRILQRHGGKIWAEALPDNGATFYFTLPSSSVA